MKSRVKYNLLLFLISLPYIAVQQTSYAQSFSSPEWSFDGDVRYRFESWNNMNALYYGNDPVIGTPNDYILLQRIVAGTTVRITQNIKVSAHLQDSRAFGWSLGHRSESDAFKKHPANNLDSYYIMNPQEEYFEIHDANIHIDSVLQMFSIIAGRQKIAFADYRVFGPGSWGNTGRWTWDAIRLSMNRTNWNGSIWYGSTKIHDPERTYLPFTNSEYNGGGIYLQFNGSGRIWSDLYYGHQHQGAADFIRDRLINRNWVGFRVYNQEMAAWKYEASLTRQFGSEENVSLTGTGIFGLFGHQFYSLPGKPCFTFRYTYASGNNPATEKNELFKPVFGAGDKYYGWMNLVSWSNLDDREIMLELFPGKNMRVEIKYNRFRIPQPEGSVVLQNLYLTSGETLLGDEIDLFTTYEVNQVWKLTAVAGYFIVKDGKTLGNANPGNALLFSMQILYRFQHQLI